MDEPRVLTHEESRRVSSLLADHDRLTGDQIVVAIFETLGGEDPVDRTVKVYEAWKPGTRERHNGAILALYWNERKARIEVGYGLEGLLTDARSKQVIDEALVPGLRAGEPGRAILSAVVAILETLESPVLEARENQEIEDVPARKRKQPLSLLVLFPVLLLLAVINRLSRAEAHYTGGGWYRPGPFRRRGGFGLGGGFGGFGGGGFGGFGGGGGRSGGGGASGSW